MTCPVKLDPMTSQGQSIDRWSAADSLSVWF
jgi:hypothetical protein